MEHKEVILHPNNLNIMLWRHFRELGYRPVCTSEHRLSVYTADEFPGDLIRTHLNAHYRQPEVNVADREECSTCGTHG